MVAHSLGYAGFTIDPATWALLGLGLALRRPGALEPPEARRSRPSPRRLPTLSVGRPRASDRRARVMFEYLRRLATTGAAYTASSVVSKLIAVFLLPVYTHYLTPADYGAAEVMLSSVIAASIVVRFGIIEAILRFYYQADERPEGVVSTGFATLFWGATIAAAIALPFAGPISEALLTARGRRTGADRDRRFWALTMFEFVLTLLRLEERARAYFGITSSTCWSRSR